MNSRLMYKLMTLALAASSLSGCAATHTAIQIGKANQAVERARDAGAEEHAVYEYTMATNYLRKSKEEAGYSDFKDSVTLATGAAEWADKAIIVIEKEGRGLDQTTLPGETRTLTEEDLVNPSETETPESDTPSESTESDMNVPVQTPEVTPEITPENPTASDTPTEDSVPIPETPPDNSTIDVVAPEPISSERGARPDSDKEETSSPEKEETP